MHLTEGRNTGFKKILDALEANGSPKPEFETNEDRSYFITRLFIHEAFKKSTNIVEGGDISNSEMKGETSFETSLKQVLKQEDYKKLEPIIRWLAKNETINIQKVMELTNKFRTTAWRYMQILVECGLVETMGNTNNVSYTKRIYKK